MKALNHIFLIILAATLSGFTIEGMGRQLLRTACTHTFRLHPRSIVYYPRPPQHHPTPLIHESHYQNPHHIKPPKNYLKIAAASAALTGLAIYAFPKTENEVEAIIVPEGPTGDLFRATWERNIEHILQAFKQKADPNGRITLFGDQSSIFEFAIAQGNPDIVKIFINEGADLRALRHNTTPLMQAIFFAFLECQHSTNLSNYEAIIKILLDAGASPYQSNHRGENALFLAAQCAREKGNHSVLNILKAHEQASSTNKQSSQETS